ncbi:MAG: hypothetical protein IPK87_02665 [Planctomycetes bacterium]|nr:hypothetical protein [Planctomycetota bacterium]
MEPNQPPGYGTPAQPNPRPRVQRGQPMSPHSPQQQPIESGTHNPAPAQPQYAPPGAPPQYGAPPQQYGAPGMPPGYGPPNMPPPYYGPPPKKGMPGWAWGLIIAGVFLFLILPIMALAAIPLVTSNTAEARQAEGEQLMGSLKNQARVAFAKTGIEPVRLTGPIGRGGEGCGASPMELDGMYYRVEDRIHKPMPGTGELYAKPLTSGKEGTLRFQYSGAEGKFTWR